jgi:hypothetical protein
VQSWLSRLHDGGALLPGTLSGITVTFVGAPLFATVKGDVCQPSLVRGHAVRDLWTKAITAAGGDVRFVQQVDPSESVIFFIAPYLLFWRKVRVKLRAMRDRSRHRYSPMAIILELLGSTPELDANDPAHQTMLDQTAHYRLVLPELKAQLNAVRDELTKHVRWIYPFLGVDLSVAVEFATCVQLFTDGGLKFPHNVLFALTLASFIVIVVIIAAKHAETTGERPWWYKLVIIGIIVFVVSMTVVRVSNAMTGDQEWWQEVGYATILLLGCIGPAIACEFCLAPLRAVLPIVRQRRELQHRVTKYQRELDELISRLSKQAALRRAWICERDILHATYDGINPPPQGSSPSQGIPLNNNEGDCIPINGGMPWIGSGSSSMRSSS